MKSKLGPNPLERMEAQLSGMRGINVERVDDISSRRDLLRDKTLASAAFYVSPTVPVLNRDGLEQLTSQVEAVVTALNRDMTTMPTEQLVGRDRVFSIHPGFMSFSLKVGSKVPNIKITIDDPTVWSMLDEQGMIPSPGPHIIRPSFIRPGDTLVITEHERLMIIARVYVYPDFQSASGKHSRIHVEDMSRKTGRNWASDLLRTNGNGALQTSELGSAD